MKIPEQLNNPNFKFVKVAKESKEAITKDWTKSDVTYKEAEKIVQGGYNVGLINKFGSLLVIDADKGELFDIVRKKLPETFTVSSQRKKKRGHFYFICKDANIGKIRLRDKLGDIRGPEGNYYTIIPPSTHPDTKQAYEVLINQPIAEITQEEIETVLKPYYDEKVDNPTDIPPSPYDITKVIDISEFKMLSNGEYQGDNPLKHGETGTNLNVDPVRNIWHDWHGDCVGGNTIHYICMLERIVPYEYYVSHGGSKCVADWQYRKALKIGREKYGLPIRDQDIVGIYRKGADGKQRLNTVGISEYFKEKQPILTIGSQGADKATVYYYKDGYYKQAGISILQKMVADFLGTAWSEHNQRQIVTHIKHTTFKTLTQIEEERNPEWQYFINLNNCVYDSRKGHEEALPHDPKYMFLYKIPINYNPKATCPKAMNFFKSTLSPNFVTISQEIFGYCLIDCYDIPAIFYLLGSGGNGKNVWLDLLTSMLGKENVTNKTIEALAGDKFCRIQLLGKRANLATEANEEGYIQSSFLKSVSDGNWISGEYKGKDSIDFKTYAKIIVACNRLPKTKDDTPGWLDRQYVIPFFKRFRGTKKEKSSLAKDIIADKEEMEGLLFWAIQGLQRLRDTNKFSYDGHQEMYEKFGTAITYFLEGCVFEATNANAEISISDMYEYYTKWCKKHSLIPLRQQAFARQLSTNGREFGLYKGRRYVDGRQERCWKGVKLSKMEGNET